jgi:hypothetical protein
MEPHPVIGRLEAEPADGRTSEFTLSPVAEIVDRVVIPAMFISGDEQGFELDCRE